MAARTNGALAAAAIALTLLPLLGSATGAGDLSFSMYASAVEFRVEVVAHEADGHDRPVAPTALAMHLSRTAFPALAGADHFRRAYSVTPLRDHLAGLATIACDEDLAAEATEVVLTERRTFGDPAKRERVTRAKATCARGK